MYFSVYHAIATFFCSVCALGCYIWLFYRRAKMRQAALKLEDYKSRSRALKDISRSFIGYLAMITAGYAIITCGVIMALEGALKSYDLRNLRHYPTGDYVRVEALVYNNGKVAFQTCEFSVRIINAAPRAQVTGEIFAPKSHNYKRQQRGRNSYEFSKEVSQFTPVHYTMRLSLRVPKPYAEYKIRAKAICK